MTTFYELFSVVPIFEICFYSQILPQTVFKATKSAFYHKYICIEAELGLGDTLWHDKKLFYFGPRKTLGLPWYVFLYLSYTYKKLRLKHVSCAIFVASLSSTHRTLQTPFRFTANMPDCLNAGRLVASKTTAVVPLVNVTKNKKKIVITFHERNRWMNG